MAILAACDGAKGAASSKFEITQPVPNSIDTLPDQAAPARKPLDDNDRIALEMAQTACKNRDFMALFSAMAVSDAVQQRYSSPAIELSILGPGGTPLSTRRISSSAYDRFPVKRVDYYFKPAEPLAAGDDGEYLDVQFNQSQSDDFAVDWARVHYDGQSQGGDDLGNMIGADGKILPPGSHPDSDGQLLFRPTADCWQLSEDIRWQK